MHIELEMNGELFKRYFLPDKYLEDLKSNSYRQNFEMREKIIKRKIKEVKHENQIFFNGENYNQISVFLSFESKMNDVKFEV